MKKIVTTALAAAMLTLTVPGAVQVASAADAVFLGGTGTGYVPQGNGSGFAKHFVPDLGTSRAVLYDGAPWANPHDAVPKTLVAIQTTPSPVWVIGLSKGAQVARATERVDTNPDTHYVFIGDPDGPNGISRVFGFSSPATIPTHDVDIVFGEYDPFADWPDQPNVFAVLNAVMAIPVHLAYGNGSSGDPLTRLDEAVVTVTDNGNGTTTTTRIIPTKHLPLTMPLRETERFLTGQTGLTDGVDSVLRPIVDSGYSRNNPKPAPKPVAPPSTSRVDTAAKDDNGVDKIVKKVKDHVDAMKTGNKFSPGDKVADKTSAKKNADEPEAKVETEVKAEQEPVAAAQEARPEADTDSAAAGE